MSSHLRKDQCCVRIGCSRPARELGGHCTTCWQSIGPEARSFLEWEAAWAKAEVEHVIPSDIGDRLMEAAARAEIERDPGIVEALDQAAINERMILERIWALPCAPDGPLL